MHGNSYIIIHTRLLAVYPIICVLGRSSQIIILNYLHDNGRLLTGELAKLMKISPSAVTRW
ncbi:winged helix-turn-helix transcriptional regulator [Anaerocolumna jejuensis]|uniref:winged helix-turn-helix transcriptional regulator n=1 Tax=Anaerocolumna jejuensis TaxID=259063 RepID=UPI001114F142